MAIFNGQCRTYKQAAELLGRDEKKPLGYETYIERIDNKTIAIRHHKTNVVTYRKNGETQLATDGWESKTTKDRINHFSPVGIKVIGGVWWLETNPPTKFQEGVTFKIPHTDEHLY